MDKKQKKDYSKYFLPNLVQARRRLKNVVTNRHSFNLAKKYCELGNGKKFFIRTYGCQSNVRDSEDITGLLQAMNFKPADDIEQADIVILNTCAVRENAEKKVFGEIGFLKRLKNKNPKFLFGICGCMPQEEAVVEKIADSIEHVNFVFGTHNIHMLPDILNQVINHQQRVIQVYSKEGEVIEGLPNARNSQVKAFVNIMYGCDKFCTYCIVPYTRGKIRSRSKEDILNEINRLIKQGYQEITLLGQNVNSYGNDFGIEYHFWNLLEDVALTNIPRVRFATSNP
jgi:tRNA-2-methylthio-N6-dimethylallyladenosine synthase